MTWVGRLAAGVTCGLMTGYLLGACASASREVGVPREYSSQIRRAAQACPGLSPELLAAQLYQESRFEPRAVSPAGARGIAQFMPETWQRWGRDLDGDGSADPFHPQEAIDAQGRLMCHLMRLAERSSVRGSPQSLALAAYNAGWGAVLQHDGIPPYRETRDYVRTIEGIDVRFPRRRD